jgi:hypothetical protein
MCLCPTYFLSNGYQVAYNTDINTFIKCIDKKNSWHKPKVATDFLQGLENNDLLKEVLDRSDFSPIFMISTHSSSIPISEFPPGLNDQLMKIPKIQNLRLDFDPNGFGVDLLAKLIRANTTLKSLHVNLNKKRKIDYDDDIVDMSYNILKNAFNANKTMQELIVDGALGIKLIKPQPAGSKG